MAKVVISTVFTIFISSLIIGKAAFHYCQSADYLKVDQTQVGKGGGKPEWRVKVTNPCSCTFANVVLACPGFQSAKKMDPWVLNQTGDSCLIDGGNGLGPHSSFSFTYIWDVSCPFKVASGEIACS